MRATVQPLSLVEYGTSSAPFLDAGNTIVPTDMVDLLKDGWRFYGVPIDEIKIRRAGAGRPRGPLASRGLGFTQSTPLEKRARAAS